MGGTGLYEAEDAVEIDGQGGAPLLFGHGVDGLIVRGPDAVVDDEDVEVAKGCDGGVDERLAVFGGGEILLEGDAVCRGPMLGDESFGLLTGGLVAEGDAGSGCSKEANGLGSDAARASGDEGGATGERERWEEGLVWLHRGTLTKHLIDTQAG